MNVYDTESEGFLTRAYLIDDGNGTAVLIDGNGVGAPLLEIARSEDLKIEAVLLTHFHWDHVMLDDYAELGVPLIANAMTRDLLEGRTIDKVIGDGDVLRFGDLSIEALHTPGHADDHTAFLVNGTELFTGDVLFKGTVGGTRSPGNSGLDELRASLRRFAALPPETVVRPGHREPSTIGEELENNVFLKALLGDEVPEGEDVLVGGEPAKLLLWGPDYDGTNKAWVLFPDGTQHMTGGSQVER